MNLITFFRTIQYDLESDNSVIDIAALLDLFPHEFGITTNVNTLIEGPMIVQMEDGTFYDYPTQSNLFYLFF
jgi:hypothetical protein